MFVMLCYVMLCYVFFTIVFFWLFCFVLFCCVCFFFTVLRSRLISSGGECNRVINAIITCYSVVHIYLCLSIYSPCNLCYLSIYILHASLARTSLTDQMVPFPQVPSGRFDRALRCNLIFRLHPTLVFVCSSVCVHSLFCLFVSV